MQLRTDLVDCHIAVCSMDVLVAFSDNFDYQVLARAARWFTVRRSACPAVQVLATVCAQTWCIATTPQARQTRPSPPLTASQVLLHTAEAAAQGCCHKPPTPADWRCLPWTRTLVLLCLACMSASPSEG